jgi:putative ABC transport system substrate-binding protein
MIKSIIGGVVVMTSLVLASLIHAQEAPKMPRIGYISGRDQSSPGPLVAAFRQGLRKLGYVEGKNIVVEYRFGATESAVFQRLIGELLNLKLDLIVVPLQVAAAKRLVTTTPIVMISNLDPVDIGLIYSLARPGGNITGVTTLSRALTRKRLELFKETVPRIERIGILRNTDDLSNSLMHVRGIEGAVRQMNLKAQIIDVHSSKPDLQDAFNVAAKSHVDGLLTLPPMLINHQKSIAKLAIEHHLATVFEGSSWVEAGGLMSYSADEPEIFRRAAGYVDKILKGAKPADLPVEEPSKFEFVINRKTAKALNLTISNSVLRRADRVIH